jgi:hypothetical protein
MMSIACDRWRRAMACAVVALVVAVLLGMARGGGAIASPQQRPESGRAAIFDRFPPASMGHDATPTATFTAFAP